MKELSFFAWSGIFLAVALGVVVLVGLLKAASKADDDMLGDLQYEEVPDPPKYECHKCGELAYAWQLRSVWNDFMEAKILQHVGGCPSERKRSRRRA